MSKREVGWGIIGSTGWADTTFGPAVAGADGAALRAVLSSSQANADAYCEKHEVPKGYSKLEDLLKDESVEAVWVASPNHFHAPQAIASLKAGKHVLCEKPMATTPSDCEAMIAAAKATGKLLGIAYHLRHHGLLQELREEFKSGALGKPVFVRAQLYFAYPTAPAEWRQKRITSGGWALGDIATHLIDLCRWYLGDVESVSGLLTNRRFGFETEDHAVLTLRFKEGIAAVVDASTGAPGPARFEVYGTEGFFVCENTFFGHGGLVTRGRIGDQPHVSGSPNVNPYRNQVVCFGRALRGECEFPALGVEGLENVKIMQAVRGY